ncbi:MAG: porin family protein [Bacteroidales bacterium]
MNRYFLLIISLMLSTSIFGQLSLQKQQENANDTIRNSDFLFREIPVSAPLATNSQGPKIEPNVPLLGIKFGTNMSDVITDDTLAIESSFISGLHGGFMYGVYYSKRFTMETGIMYEGKGYVKNNTNRETYETNDLKVTILNKYNYSSRFHYLTIPVNGRITIGKHVQFYATFGIYTGIPILTNMDGSYRVKTIERDKVSGIAEEYETDPQKMSGNIEALEGLDFGASGGLGLHWPINTKGFTGPTPALFMDIQYKRSLASIGKATKIEIDDEEYVFPPPEAYNFGIAITAGFTFPLGVK